MATCKILAKYLQKSVDNFGVVPIIIDMSKQVTIGQRVKFAGEEWCTCISTFAELK